VEPPLEILVVRDRTIMERQEIRRVYVELDARKAKGERNIAIRYTNGVPSIVLHRYDKGANIQSAGHSTLPSKS
jgi:hypothetical protein